MNADDERRDQILRFLYERHRSSRGPAKIPIGIRDLNKEMKSRHDMRQQDVSANVDYLLESGWVREVIKDRSFKTAKGMEVSQEQVKFKITESGISRMEAGTVFQRPKSMSTVNITNIRGLTIVGDGNVVNSDFTDAARALSELDAAIAAATDLSPEQKVETAADVATIRTQVAKRSPSKEIIGAAWASLRFLATVNSVMTLYQRVAGLLGFGTPV